jgi:hypothetical protein
MRTFFGACALGAAMLFGIACGQSGKPVKELNPEELAKLLEKPENIFFLDVREPSEIAKLGTLKGYVNIPVSQLEGRLKEIPRDKVIVTL